MRQQRFDWLVAMDAGKIIATGTTPQILQKTGEKDLDAAFIALLPEAERAQHHKVVMRPRSPSDDSVPAIEADGLTRRFGTFTAVDHVSIRIARGEIFGFLGSNGCGKSTTMKMLTGLLPATSGWAKLFGAPMGSNDMEARRNVGYMSQAFSLYSELDDSAEFGAPRAALPSTTRRDRRSRRGAAEKFTTSTPSPTRVQRACRWASSRDSSLPSRSYIAR